MFSKMASLTISILMIFSNLHYDASLLLRVRHFFRQDRYQKWHKLALRNTSVTIIGIDKFTELADAVGVE